MRLQTRFSANLIPVNAMLATRKRAIKVALFFFRIRKLAHEELRGIDEQLKSLEASGAQQFSWLERIRWCV